MREIKALTAVCDGQRQDLAQLTSTYQEKVLPALAETCAVLAEMKLQIRHAEGQERTVIDRDRP